MKELLWDARGEDGQRGYEGEDGSSGYGRSGGSGSSGGRGSDAGPGGEILALLRSDSEGEALVEGLVNRASRSERIWLSKHETLLLTARGGNGGHGGGGGAGEWGKAGHPGSDATRYSSGGDGGPGGDGGNGGAAGAGGNAGAGGSVRLEVSNSDLDLLLAVHWDVAAGARGLAGAPGEGGRGGAGGAGGSSYTWTESESYTDSQGQTQTRTNYRSNPGGSDGNSGFDGRRGATAKPGAEAEPGRFVLRIEGQDYPDRYRFRCPDYRVVAGGGNSIFEFGQTANRVEGAGVENRGKSPGPDKTIVCLLPSRGVSPHQVQGFLKGVPVGGVLELAPLLFDLEEAAQEKLPSLHRRYREKVVVEPRLNYPRLAKYDPEYSNPKEIEVTFPIELETVVSTTSLAPGVEVVQEWRVHNLGTASFPPPGRRVLVDLWLERAGVSLQILRESGEVFEVDDEPRFYLEIGSIPPGESALFSAKICAPVDSVPYAKVTLCADLRLTPCGGGEARTVQRNPTEFNIAMVQEPKVSDVLLITHHGCTSVEVESWLRLFSGLSLSYSVWDVSFHGCWPVERLAEFVQGKLTVVLEREFEIPNRERARVSDFLSLSGFRHSISVLGVSYYIVGDKGALLKFLISQPEEARNFHSLAEYLDSPVRQRRVNPEVPLEFERTMDRISISKFFVAGEPRPEFLKEKARELLKELQRRNPQHQYLVTTVFDPHLAQSGWLKTKDCGILEVRKLPDRDARAVVVRQVQRANVVRAEFLLSAENLLGFFSAQDFDDKLGVMKSPSNLAEALGLVALEALADAVLLDFLEEQRAMRRSTARYNKKEMASALNRATEFCATDFRTGGVLIEPDSPLGALLLRIVAGVRFVTSGQLSQWDHRIRFLGGTGDVEINIYVAKQLDAFLDRNFGPDRLLGTGANRRVAEEKIKEREAQLVRQRELVQSQSREFRPLDKSEASIEALVRWELRDFLESGVEVESLIWSQSEMEELQEQEARHQKHRESLLNLYERALKDSGRWVVGPIDRVAGEAKD